MTLMQIAQAGFNAQNAEAQASIQQQHLVVHALRATGSGNIDETFSLDRRFRLVYVRCHFTGTTTPASMRVSEDSGAGSEYDAELVRVTQAGVNRDVNLRTTDGELVEPSPWRFESADGVRVEWINPDPGNITWGLEVGLAAGS